MTVVVCRYVGLIIGVLLTLISLLLAGILLVIYRSLPEQSRAGQCRGEQGSVEENRAV